MIKLNNVSKKYNDFYALKDICLEIKENEFITIFGKSGSGKTTLLNIIGLIDSFDGEYELNNSLIDLKNEKLLSKLRNESFGYIFQSYNVDPFYTVYENIKIPLIISKKKKSKEEISNLLDMLGLKGFENKKCSELSGGEKQRVAILRALINDANIILADEPTGALDSENSKKIFEILKKLNDSGKTIILVTHDEAMALQTKRIITLEDGRIIDDKYI